MRIIKTVRLNGKEVPLQSENLMLEINNSGRGFVTVKTEEETKGKNIVIELGEYDHYFKWFNGYVEEEQAAEKGYKRLFIRENVGRFEKPLSCSLRHITLKNVCEWIESKTGVEFIVPDKPYATTPIPLCTHAGSGYQLLNTLGRLFKIPDYMWQQSPDNSVFVGSWTDSKWNDENVEIGDLEALSQGSKSMIIPVNAAIRPGCLVNGNRITKVVLNGDRYELEWESLESGRPEFKSPERRKMEQEFPELAGGYHLSKFAKIVAVADPSSGGEISDPFRPKYAVDVQLLDEYGNDDTGTPVFPAVPLPVTGTSSQGGDFAFPEIGTVVEIGFINGRSDQPVIRNFYPTGKTIPAVGIGEMLRQQRPEVFERTDAAGNIHKETDQTISEKSYNRQIETDSETKTLGKKSESVLSDSETTVGGNSKKSVLGNIETATAADYNLGVGGNLTLRTMELLSLLSKTKAEIKAPQVHLGSENINTLRILETLLQIVADLASDVEQHTHPGVGPPAATWKEKFKQAGRNAQAEKEKLSPIVA